MTEAERWAANVDELTKVSARLIVMSEAETSTSTITHLEWAVRDLQRLARSYTDRLKAHAELRRQLEDSLNE